jgi:cholesterol oxidase
MTDMTTNRRLSLPLTGLQDTYDVVVVGSGYGGAISASRLSRADLKVCLLELGKELHPGEYPADEMQAVAHAQVDFPEGKIGSPTNMLRFHVSEEMNVYLGCGLGGTSLVNANVSLEAEPRVFKDPRWPAELRNNLVELQDGIAKAKQALSPTPYPEDAPALHKLEAHEVSAKSLGNFYRTPINVNFTDRVNDFGVFQPACTGCGDCVSGCNVGAKNTLLMNYLPDAFNHGAEIFCEVEVRFIERSGDYWIAHYQDLSSGRSDFGDAPLMQVRAKTLILCAGVLGTNEILLRSKEKGLAMSDTVGSRFTGNGDVLAFAYNTESEINAVGFGRRPAKSREPVGPCITGVIDLREQQELADGMVIQEGSFPGAIGSLLPEGLGLAAKFEGENTVGGAGHLIHEKLREVESLTLGPYKGAIRNTQVYLVMGHDDSEGKLYLKDDRVRISWPGVGDKPIFQKISDNLKKATEPLKGTYLRNPIWTKLMHDRLVTVHPLGGCVMAGTAEDGVVNHKGQVFSGSTGAIAYENFYISDGSVIPVSLGVNPLLTISGLAERMCSLMARDKDFIIDYSIAKPVERPQAPQTLGIEFTEKMAGYLAVDPQIGEFAEAEAMGKARNSAIEFVLTVVAEDMDDFVNVPDHAARMDGTVTCAALSAEPLSLTEGKFNLLITDPDRASAEKMQYKATLTAADGKRFLFEGFKEMTEGSPLEAWPQTTTLYVTIRDELGKQVGKGIMYIRPADFFEQMRSMKALRSPGPVETAETLLRFQRFFAGRLLPIYGGVFEGTKAFDTTAPPRLKRLLRVGAPEVFPIKTDDGVEILLTRYRGGDKGPVMVAHGLGVSSLIFSMDTIETNLLEFLYAHGYDVWLLDFRDSILLAESKAPWDADQVANFDFPAAVKKILEVTGKPDLQAVVHCYGATTFFMSMLNGLQGVRSLVSSQIGLFAVAPPLTKIKCGLHVPDLLKYLGVPDLDALSRQDEGWFAKLFDKALVLQPVPFEERCDSGTCHRITFLYSLLYEHANLNPATHDALHEMFGIANMKAFQHLGQIVRHGQLVDFEGQDIYLPNLDRLRLPICFIHGAANMCFLPEGTKLTMDALTKANGTDFYTRHLVPGYGHIDCIFGANAARDIYPLILNHLEKTAEADERVVQN